MATLFMVATPIGNLKDITFRAVERLWNVDVLLCEDTRKTGRLLKHYEGYSCGKKPKLLSYTDFNRTKRIPYILTLLQEGKNVAFVSNAGAPLISDPGYKLVQAVYNLNDQSIAVDVLPGANAVVTALQVSGLPPDRFCFVGFLPRNKAKRRRFLQKLPHTTIVAFESPRRLTQSLNDILEVCGDVHIAVCLEMTKIHQAVMRGTVQEVIDKIGDSIKGEATIVFNYENAG